MFTQKNPHQHGRVKPEVVPKISPTMFVSFSYFEFSTVATHSQSLIATKKKEMMTTSHFPPLFPSEQDTFFKHYPYETALCSFPHPHQ